MNNGVLGVVTIDTIHKRAVNALHARQNGRKLSDPTVDQLLHDLIRVIDSHEKQAVRMRHAAMVLESNDGT
jgi:hypothetical protein